MIKQPLTAMEVVIHHYPSATAQPWRWIAVATQEGPLNKPPSLPSVVTQRRVILAAIVVGCAALGSVVARSLFAAARGTAPWILPVVVVGTLAVVLICVLVLLPLLSRRT